MIRLLLTIVTVNIILITAMSTTSKLKDHYHLKLFKVIVQLLNLLLNKVLGCSKIENLFSVINSKSINLYF